MSWRGMNEDAYRILSVQPTAGLGRELAIQRLTLEGFAYTRLHQYPLAKRDFDEAEGLCLGMSYQGCGELSRARGLFAIELGQLPLAKSYFDECLRFAQLHRYPWLEATALLNLGVTALQGEQYDEAIDWSLEAARVSEGIGAEVVLLSTQGNLGWAYYKLGDSQRALEMYQEAQKRSIAIGDIGGAIVWLTDLGYVYQEMGELQQALQSHQKALELARQINSKEDVITALEDLAHVSLQQERPPDAEGYLAQVEPLIVANGNRLDALDVALARGKIAAARTEVGRAEGLFREVENDPASQTSMKLGAEHELARLYESVGRAGEAEKMYRAALGTFEGAREQLKEEDSKLPFLANAAGIYDDYVDFLIGKGRVGEALLVADGSRARTLAGTSGGAGTPEFRGKQVVNPQAVARKAGATLLFYWMGERRSYLWAVTGEKTRLFELPARSVVAPLVERYRKALLREDVDPLEAVGSAGNAAGRELYAKLVAPAESVIQSGRPVMILADGELSQLNFETLLVSGPGSTTHYWIEDVALMAAPSLAMLAGARLEAGNGRSRGKLLLMGDAVSAGPEYPRLDQAAAEMALVQKHFGANAVEFSGARATPRAYLGSEPGNFAYIHFVTHGVASRREPLNSAIVLSPEGATGEEAFKLYAKDVMQHRLNARLVTISACNGSGTVAYRGEGLVGLSWAFLRAGAHNAIGALWEVSDESTPKLMDALYAGLESGLGPAEALRRAKLGLVHSAGRFKRAYYWAPFQIYTRL